jgi:hypothetical protein
MEGWSSNQAMCHQQDLHQVEFREKQSELDSLREIEIK